MAFSRRLFLRHGVMAAAACVSSPLLALNERRAIGGEEEGDRLLSRPSSLSGNWEDHAGALDHLERNAFSGAVGTSFKVYLTPGASPVWVTLQAVEDLPRITAANPASFAVANKTSSIAPATSGYVLVFGGSSALPQGTSLFEHETLGRFALFTVPDGNGQQLYTGVVNRLDSNYIIAVPYVQGKAATTADSKSAGSNAGNSPGTVAVAPTGVQAGLMNSAATSAAIETPAHGPAGSPGARRSAVRD